MMLIVGRFGQSNHLLDDDSADLDVKGFALPNVEGVAVEVIEGQIGFVEILPSAVGREVRTKLRKALGAE